MKFEFMKNKKKYTYSKATDGGAFILLGDKVVFKTHDLTVFNDKQSIWAFMDDDGDTNLVINGKIVAKINGDLFVWDKRRWKITSTNGIELLFQDGVNVAVGIDLDSYGLNRWSYRDDENSGAMLFHNNRIVGIGRNVYSFNMKCWAYENANGWHLIKNDKKVATAEYLDMLIYTNKMGIDKHGCS